MPPPVETGKRVGGPSNDRTYTSSGPASAEMYATHFPSRDTVGMYSLKRVAMNDLVDAVSPMVEIIRSIPVPRNGTREMMRFPSGTRAISATVPTELPMFLINSCGLSVHYVSGEPSPATGQCSRCFPSTLIRCFIMQTLTTASVVSGDRRW